MARTETITCENPKCGKDVTQGEGRMTRVMLMSEVIAQRPLSTPKHDAGVVMGQTHFCDINCVAEWSADQSTKWRAEESTYQLKVAEANKEPLSSPASDA